MTNFRLLGAGSPLVDYSLEISDDLLQKYVPGGKGSTRNISLQEKENILAVSSSILRSPGGSAANTIRIFSALGGDADHFGKIGDDADADYFQEELLKSGAFGKLLVRDKDFYTGYCLSLITPDAERTMLSDLGASVQIKQDELDIIDFTGFGLLLVEGYMIGQSWLPEMIRRAKKHRCRIALDLNNFELVDSCRQDFHSLLSAGVDILFANLQEAQALCEKNSISEITGYLQKNIPLSVLKLGREGAVIIDSRKIFTAPPAENCRVTDTTGAGDYFAAGFLYGLNRSCRLEKCAELGSICAGAIISKTGVLLNDHELQQLKYHINREVNL